MNGMKNVRIESAFQKLVARIQADIRSDSSIARLSGVSQPTVSRLRNAPEQRSRGSKSFNRLCSFYGIAADVAGGEAGYNEQLRYAIIDAWDGTVAHGRALLLVIKGLKELQDSTRGNAGE
jgi:hypothetical protein